MKSIPFTINPDGRPKQLWDAFVLGVTVLAAVETPLRLALQLPLTGGLLALEVFISACFLADMVLNFITPVNVNGQLVTSRKEIARHYLKGWFLVDLLSIFPWAIFGALWEEMRLLRLLRLVRIADFMRRMAKENVINASVLRMIFLGFWVALFAHLAACIWITLGAGNIGPEWASHGGLLYLRSLYWAVTTIATIGYGDVTPVTPLQTGFTIVVEVIGAGLYGYVIAIFASLIANLDSARRKFSEQLDEINTFMRFRKIPADLQKQIRSYYDHLWESRRGYNEAHVLADLPDSLKLKVSTFINKSMLDKVPIFEGAGAPLVEELLMHLKPAIFTPGDYVFRTGDVGDCMYFVNNGRVEVVSGDGGTVFATLSPGSYFGETALLLNQPRNACVRAVDYVDLYTLNRSTLGEILEKFPAFQTHLHELAAERQAGKKA